MVRYTVRLEGSKNDGDDTNFDASNEERALSVLLACPASLVIPQWRNQFRPAENLV